MKQGARAVPGDPILVDDAHTFGVSLWEPGKRGKGILLLTGEQLAFIPDGKEPATVIPLSDIQSFGAAARTEAGPQSRSVLRVTYRRNLVLGVSVESPERWVNAIETLSRQRGDKAVIDRPVVSRFEVQKFRVVVGMFLLLIVLLSTALPLFFGWMSARVNQSQPETPPASGFPAQAY